MFNLNRLMEFDMANEARDVKFQLMVSPSELTRIEEYRWGRRLESKAEAMRQLIAKGLEAEAEAKEGQAA